MGMAKKAILYRPLSAKIYQVSLLLDILTTEFHAYKSSSTIETLLEDAEIVAAIVKQSFQKLNKNIENSEIDAQLSGTTCCMLLITATTMYCANVGDSRAILLSHSSQSLSSTPLSKDHKPDEPFEKKRIIQCKGRVMPICGI